MHRSLLLAAPVFIAAAGSAHAAVDITLSTTYPTDPEFQTYDPAASGSIGQTLAPGASFTQTFTPDTAVTAGSIFFQTSNRVQGSEIDVDVFGVETAPAPVAGPFLLDSAVLSFTSDGSSIVTHEIALSGSDTIAFEDDVVYGIRFTNTGTANVNLRRSPSDLFEPGDLFVGSTNLNRDAVLAITAVPEPGSMALLASGGLLLLARRRSDA